MDILAPVQALDLQAQLADRFRDREFAAACNRWYAAWGERTDITTADWAAGNAQSLREASCFHVSADMTVMIDYASRQLAADDVFRFELLPAERGFAYFAEPLPVTDADGLTYVVRCLQWEVAFIRLDDGQEVRGLQVVYWVAPDDTGNAWMFKRERMREVTPFMRPLYPHHFSFIPHEAKVGSGDLRSDVEGGPDWLPEDIQGDATNITRLVVAFLMLLDQTVTETEDAAVPRAAAKRSARAGVAPRVTVINLRRHAGSRKAGESLVEWTRRWPVRGHWRRQRYKAEDGATIFRKIWIAPYVKGPADKPIVVSKKVYRVTPE